MPRLLSSALLLSALAVLFGPATQPIPVSHAEAADVYTCPMHPEVTDTKPGHCPKCKMKLVPK